MAKKKAEEKEEAPRKVSSSRNQQIEDYLNMKYQFRFNSIKRMPEFISADTVKEPWKLMNDYKLNSIKRELDSIGINSSTSNVWEILSSEYAGYINPIKDYFEKLPKWDGTDHISFLCSTVTVHNPDKWEEYFKKWITGVVANVFIENYCANHLCLVLTGSQGKFKTTWLDNLCPPALREHYIYTGKIDPNNKDVLTYISEYLFINIDDQLRQLNKQDENQLKNLITTPSVKYRRPYDRAMSYYPHTASFMASVNGNDFLTDPTGNRRFLPFEVTDIDIDKAQKQVNMDQVYAQALNLFKNRFQYWFNDVQVIELHENNQRFQVTSAEEELLLEWYEKGTRKTATDYLTRTAIRTYLEGVTKMKLNEKRLSEALYKLDYEQIQRTIPGQGRQRVWLVIQKDFQQVERARKNSENLYSDTAPVPIEAQADIPF